MRRDLVYIRDCSLQVSSSSLSHLKYKYCERNAAAGNRREIDEYRKENGQR